MLNLTKIIILKIIEWETQQLKKKQNTAGDFVWGINKNTFFLFFFLSFNRNGGRDFSAVKRKRNFIVPIVSRSLLLHTHTHTERECDIGER